MSLKSRVRPLKKSRTPIVCNTLHFEIRTVVGVRGHTPPSVRRNHDLSLCLCFLSFRVVQVLGPWSTGGRSRYRDGKDSNPTSSDEDSRSGV